MKIEITIEELVELYVKLQSSQERLEKSAAEWARRSNLYYGWLNDIAIILATEKTADAALSKIKAIAEEHVCERIDSAF